MNRLPAEPFGYASLPPGYIPPHIDGRGVDDHFVDHHYNDHFEVLVERGYLPLPIIPGGKAPGTYGGTASIDDFLRPGGTDESAAERYNRYSAVPFPRIGHVYGRPLKGWNAIGPGHDFSHLKSPASGVGLLCGLGLAAVDIDTDDDAVMEVYRHWLGQIAGSGIVVERRGRVGLALLVRTDDSFGRSRFSLKGGTGIDILAGAGGQIVIPPTTHPRTLQPYAWLTDATALSTNRDDLVFVGSVELALLQTMLADAGLLAESRINGPRRINDYVEEVPSERVGSIKSLARKNYHLWVPHLPTALGIEGNGDNWRGTAVWRPSSKEPGATRDKELRFDGRGIYDFGGSGQIYTAISLVEAALGCTGNVAMVWLEERLAPVADQILPELPPWNPIKGDLVEEQIDVAEPDDRLQVETSNVEAEGDLQAGLREQGFVSIDLAQLKINEAIATLDQAIREYGESSNEYILLSSIYREHYVNMMHAKNDEQKEFYQELRARLSEELDLVEVRMRAFPAMLIEVGTGLGKTKAIIEWLCSNAGRLYKFGGALFTVPTHRKAEEIAEDIRSTGMTSVAVYRGYDAEAPEQRDLSEVKWGGRYFTGYIDGHRVQYPARETKGEKGKSTRVPYEAMCLRPGDKVAFEKAGGNGAELCRDCPLENTCAKKVNEAECKDAVIVVAAHGVLFGGMPKVLSPRLLWFIDENPLDTSLTGTSEQKLATRGYALPVLTSLPNRPEGGDEAEAKDFEDREVQAVKVWRAVEQACQKAVEEASVKSTKDKEVQPVFTLSALVVALNETFDRTDEDVFAENNLVFAARMLINAKTYHQNGATYYRNSADLSPGGTSAWSAERRSAAIAEEHTRRAKLLLQIRKALKAGGSNTRGDVRLVRHKEQWMVAADAYTPLADTPSLRIVTTATAGRPSDLVIALGRKVELIADIRAVNHDSTETIQIINAPVSATALGEFNDGKLTETQRQSREQLVEVLEYLGLLGEDSAIIARDASRQNLGMTSRESGCNFAVAPGLNNYKGYRQIASLGYPNPHDDEYYSRARKLRGDWIDYAPMVTKSGEIIAANGQRHPISYRSYAHPDVAAAHESQCLHAVEQAIGRGRFVWPNGVDKRRGYVFGNMPMHGVHVDRVVEFDNLLVEARMHKILMAGGAIATSPAIMFLRYPHMFATRTHGIRATRCVSCASQLFGILPAGIESHYIITNGKQGWREEFLFDEKIVKWLEISTLRRVSAQNDGHEITIIALADKIDEAIDGLGVRPDSASALDQYVHDCERDGLVVTSAAGIRSLAGDVGKNDADSFAASYVPLDGWMGVELKVVGQRGRPMRGYVRSLEDADHIATAMFGKPVKVSVPEAPVKPEAPMASNEQEITEETNTFGAPLFTARPMAHERTSKTAKQEELDNILHDLAGLNVIAAYASGLEKHHHVPKKHAVKVVALLAIAELSQGERLVEARLDVGGIAPMKARFIVRGFQSDKEAIERLTGKSVLSHEAIRLKYWE